MANNRMYLVHVPTGKSLYIARQSGLEWYNNRIEEPAPWDKFFQDLRDEGHWDSNFAITMEGTEDAPFAYPARGWNYDMARMNEDGIRTLEMIPIDK
jgi:hypothetical protein